MRPGGVDEPILRQRQDGVCQVDKHVHGRALICER
jgi:hypothetical protein